MCLILGTDLINAKTNEAFELPSKREACQNELKKVFDRKIMSVALIVFTEELLQTVYNLMLVKSKISKLKEVRLDNKKRKNVLKTLYTTSYKLSYTGKIENIIKKDCQEFIIIKLPGPLQSDKTYNNQFSTTNKTTFKTPYHIKDTQQSVDF